MEPLHTRIQTARDARRVADETARDARRVAAATEPQRIQATADAFTHNVVRALMTAPRVEVNDNGEWHTQVSVAEAAVYGGCPTSTQEERWAVAVATLRRRLDAMRIRLVKVEFGAKRYPSLLASMAECLTMGLYKPVCTDTVKLVLGLKEDGDGKGGGGDGDSGNGSSGSGSSGSSSGNAAAAAGSGAAAAAAAAPTPSTGADAGPVTESTNLMAEAEWAMLE